MTMSNQDGNQSTQHDGGNKPNDSANKENKDKSLNTSGDPGRTPGSAEGDEETVDEDIRQKEAEGKL